MLFKNTSRAKNYSAEENFSKRRRVNPGRFKGVRAICFLTALLFIFPWEGKAIEPPGASPSLEASSMLSVGIDGYQKFLSPVLDSKCYMLPSCSAYAKQALSEYGPFLGLLLTIDRLFREADEDQTSSLVQQGNNVKLFDPPSANVWWKK